MVVRRSSKIRLVIVEDEDLFRDLLRTALDRLPRLSVVGDFADGETALAEAPPLEPRAALLDIEPGGAREGVQLGLRLRRRLPGVGIVLLSNREDAGVIGAVPPEAVAGWSYLLKRSVGDAEALGRAIEGAAAGLVVLDPRLVEARRPRAGEALDRLTGRQREVLTLIAEGYTNAAIANQLVLAEKSVENQINLLYRELGIDRANGGLHPRVQAVLRFLQQSQRA